MNTNGTAPRHDGQVPRPTTSPHGGHEPAAVKPELGSREAELTVRASALTAVAPLLEDAPDVVRAADLAGEAMGGSLLLSSRRVAVGMGFPALGEHIFALRLQHRKFADLRKIARQATFSGDHRKRVGHKILLSTPRFQRGWTRSLIRSNRNTVFHAQILS